MSIPQSGGALIESYEQLAGYLSDGCKPKENWKIGTEHEKFGFRKSDFSPLQYDGECSIKAMLNGLKENVIVGKLIPAGTGNVIRALRKEAKIRDNSLLKQLETPK